MEIKIILPVYNDWESQMIPEGAFLYPEEKKTPRQQMDFLKEAIGKKSSQDNIFVVTTSPYLAEGFNEIKTSDGSLIEPIYSDGKSNIDSDTFWKHFALPMKETFFYDKELTLKN